MTSRDKQFVSMHLQSALLIADLAILRPTVRRIQSYACQVARALVPRPERTQSFTQSLVAGTLTGETHSPL